MTIGESSYVITPEDVMAFGHKLAAWATELSPQEQAMLLDTIARAAATEGTDVEGFVDVDVPRPDYVASPRLTSSGRGTVYTALLQTSLSVLLPLLQRPHHP
jgi:hypothetical protein